MRSGREGVAGLAGQRVGEVLRAVGVTREAARPRRGGVAVGLVARGTPPVLRHGVHQLRWDRAVAGEAGRGP